MQQKQKKFTRDELIGMNIRTRRLASDMTSKDLAEKLSPPISYQQINKYEHGKNKTSTSMLLNIAEVLKVDVHKLIYGEEWQLEAESESGREEINLVRAYNLIPHEPTKKYVRGLISSLADHLTRAMPRA